MEHKNGSLILIAGKILFGTAAIAVRLLPVHYLSLLLAMHLFAFFGFWRQAKPELKHVLRGRVMLLLIGISVAFTITDATYYIAVRQIDVSLATLIRWIAPVVGVLVATVFREPVTTRGRMGTIIAFLGLAVVLWGRGLADAQANAGGILLALISALAVVIYWLGSKVALRSISASLLI